MLLTLPELRRACRALYAEWRDATDDLERRKARAWLRWFARRVLRCSREGSVIG